MFANGALRAAFLAGAAITTTMAAPAAAQVQPSADYDLPAQDLGDTLRAIARTAGREIIFTPEAVQGRRAPALRGKLTFEEAVQRAVGDSGLTAELRAGAVLIRERGAGAPAPTESSSNSITVTGTRIRGNASPSPVTVTTRRQLEEQGVSDLAGFTRVLPQNYTGGVNPGIAGGGQQGGQSNINNSAALNLRGLGPDATLTLLNGHRIAYDALNQGIDISAIPLGAIERVEIIPDGASALYGSDAVGGVANIVLRRDYKGLETTARVGGATDGGDFQQQYTLVGGNRWSSGGFMAAVDYSTATPIFAGQRDYTRALDPSLTLTLRNRQLSGVVAAHQSLATGVELDLDGYAMDRHSAKQSPFLPNLDAGTFGLITHPSLTSWSLTPTLRFNLPAGWQAFVSGTRAVSRTALDSRIYIFGAVTPSHLVYENGTSAVEAGAEGPVLALPGGDARLAVGAGYRSLVLDANVTQTVGGTPTTILDFTERRGVTFAYGELSLPLVGPDLHIPLVHRLTFDAAVRYERYRGIDSVATPKLGIVYEPASDVTVRASWGRAFKAPTLYQVNQGLQGALLPGSLFAPQPTPPLAPDATVLLLAGGNPDLRSERARTWSTTLEVSPRFARGLHLQADYFDIDYRDRIGTPLSGTLSALANLIFRDLITFDPTAAQVNALIPTLTQGFSNQSGSPFDPANVGAIIDGSLRNTARVHARGVDLQADYRAELGGSKRLFLTAAASYLESDQQLAPGQPVIAQAGTIFHPPHWRGRAGAVFDSRRAGVAAFINYVGGTKDNRFADAPGPGPFVTLDLTASIRTGRHGPFGNIEFRLSALNLLNEKPNIIRNSDPAAPSYDSTNQSPVGRFLSLAVRKTW